MSGNPAFVSDPVLSEDSHWLKAFSELTKIHLSLYIALSAVFGHVLAQNKFSMGSLGLGFFVLILTAGSAIFNHIQDRRFDPWFARTRNRCLVQKRITPSTAGFFATALVLTGLGGLFFCFPCSGSAGLGLLALYCYNALYTPLKKISLVAIVPGALCGMLPPAIGWAAVPRSMAVADVTGLFIVLVVFGVWQISHFFIILLKQLPGEVEAAPFPSFLRIFSRREIKGQILIWTSLYSLGVLLFLLKGWIHSPGLSLVLGGVSLVLPLLMAAILGRKQNASSISLCFFAINLSMLFFMGAGILDRI